MTWSETTFWVAGFVFMAFLFWLESAEAQQAPQPAPLFELEPQSEQCPRTVEFLVEYADWAGLDTVVIEGPGAQMYLDVVNRLTGSRIQHDYIFVLSGGDGPQYAWILFMVYPDLGLDVDWVCSPYFYIEPEVHQDAHRVAVGIPA